MANEVKTPIQNYFEKVLYENLIQHQVDSALLKIHFVLRYKLANLNIKQKVCSE